ncbi:MAG: hypothetical protein ABI658_02850 [Acidimicrobiales bacterium]
MNPRRTLLTSATLLCLFALAACGGGDDTKTTAADGSSTPTSTSATASGGGSASGVTTTTIEFKGSGSGNLCDYAKDIESSKTLEDAFSSKSDTKTLKDGFSKMQDVMNTAVGKAPSEIKADLQTLQKGFKAIGDFYASYDYDVTKLTAAIQKDPTIANKLAVLDSADYSAASDRVDAYFEKVCGIKSN